MLVFVIPLKSPKISSSWDLVSKLFERTLKSVCNQTSPNFRVIVVCNEKPKIEFSHSHVNYIEVDFPVPETNINRKNAGYKGREIDVRNSAIFTKDVDKGRKLLTGLAAAEKFAPSHAMIVDADDCVSRRLAEFVDQNPQSNGWFINKGFFYVEGSRFIYIRPKKFNELCGTGILIKYSLYKLIFDRDDYNHQETVLEGGIVLKTLPFLGAVYIRGNGENIFMNENKLKEIKDAHQKRGIYFHIRDAFQYRLLTKSIRNEFGLYSID